VSLAAARLTLQFGFSELQRDMEFSERQMRQALVKSLDIVVEENAGWQRFFALSAIRPIHLTTDRLVADHDGVIEEIAAACGVTVNAASLAAMVEIDGPYAGGKALKQALAALLDRMSPSAFGRTE
jgi:LPS sulfotransferase NodH